MKDTSLLSKEHVLGKSYRGFDVEPLDKLYYGAYPYRVNVSFTVDPRLKDHYAEFMADYLGEPIDVADLDMKIINELTVRTKCARTKRVLKKLLKDTEFRQNYSVAEKWKADGSGTEFRADARIFLLTQQDLDVVLDYVNRSNVQGIEAIQNDDQLELMNDPRFETVSRPSPFWNQYDYKVEILTERDRVRHWTATEVRNYLDDMGCKGDYKLRKNWKTVTVFGNHDVVMEVLPMIRFQMKLEKFRITRAVVPD